MSKKSLAELEIITTRDTSSTTSVHVPGNCMRRMRPTAVGTYIVHALAAGRHGSAQVGERVFEFRAPLEFGSQCQMID